MAVFSLRYSKKIMARIGFSSYRVLHAVILVTLFAPPGAAAYETDQHTGRGSDIEDSTAVLNAKVNATIAAIAADWDEGHDEMASIESSA